MVFRFIKRDLRRKLSFAYMRTMNKERVYSLLQANKTYKIQASRRTLVLCLDLYNLKKSIQKISKKRRSNPQFGATQLVSKFS